MKQPPHNQKKNSVSRVYCLCALLYATPNTAPETDTVCYDTVYGIKEKKWDDKLCFDVTISIPSGKKGILGYSHMILGSTWQDYKEAWFFTFFQNDVTTEKTLNFIVPNLYARYGRFLATTESIKQSKKLFEDGESSQKYLDKLF